MTNHISKVFPIGNAPTSQVSPAEKFILDDGLLAVVSTNVAAALINRKPQTLRIWACRENGPIRPIRINGRLAWRVSDLQALLEGDVR